YRYLCSEFQGGFFGDKNYILIINLLHPISIRYSFYPFSSDSEYLLRRGYPENRIYRYSLYLSDNPDENRIKELKDFLEKDSRINIIEFISKEKASEIAEKEMGIPFKEMFEGDIFPASFDIESFEELNFGIIENGFSDLIDETVENRPIVNILYRIQT
ncbi:MAG: permease-like cell division protein FtsX, partial [Weeksellaceae bacterium]